MIEDTIEIKYPIEKLWTEEVDRNHRKEEIRQVSIEYILRFDEKEIPSVFLRKVKMEKTKMQFMRELITILLRGLIW